MIRIMMRLLFCSCLIMSLPCHAFSMKPWLENTNQRAARLMAEEKYADAEKAFTRPDWQAVAAYRGKDYDKAAKYFKQLNNAQGFYNHGNTLAQLGQYQAAINAYEKAIKLNPNNQDAIYNRDLIKKLLEQNKQDPKQDQKNQDKKQQDQDKRQQDQKQQEQDQEQQNQDKKDQDQKDQNQKQQDQSGNEQDQNEKKEDQDKRKHDQDQKQQEQEQALRLVPDDPGGLLREKFWRDHWRRAKAAQS
jgi:Ca-activated chloride channel homolog